MVVANRSKEKNIVDTVFTMVKKAKNRKEEIGQEKVIDVTIGSLFSDDGKLVVFDALKKSHLSLTPPQYASYAESFIGNKKFLDSVTQWAIGKESYSFKTLTIGTPGGSGSISSAFKNILDPKATVLLPSIGWSPYKLIAKEHDLKFETYELFDSQGFNLDSFRKKGKEIMEREGKVLAVINDPCHNPTGYSLTLEEWNKVVEVANELSTPTTPFIILNDVAYIDYSFAGYNGSREYMKSFQNLKDENLVILAFSCSKSLTGYGLRVGASIIISNSSETAKGFYNALEFSSRGIWSNIPNGGMNIFSMIHNSPSLLSSLKEERGSFIEVLKERASSFIEEAKKVDLPIYPYRGGFFITVPVIDRDIDLFIEELNEREVFPIKVDFGIRIAISSCSKEKLVKLPKIIAEILKK